MCASTHPRTPPPAALSLAGKVEHTNYASDTTRTLHAKLPDAIIQMYTRKINHA